MAALGFVWYLETLRGVKAFRLAFDENSNERYSLEEVKQTLLYLIDNPPQELYIRAVGSEHALRITTPMEIALVLYSKKGIEQWIAPLDEIRRWVAFKATHRHALRAQGVVVSSLRGTTEVTEGDWDAIMITLNGLKLDLCQEGPAWEEEEAW